MAQKISKKVSDYFSSYQTKRLGKSETLIQAGETPDGIYYLIKGRVGQGDIDENGNELIVNIFKPGSFFPLHWAIAQKNSPYYFICLEDIVFIRAPRQDVVDFLLKEPEVLMDVLQRVYSGVDGLLRKNLQLMGGNASTRLLHELVISYERFGKRTEDGRCFIPIKETDLAKCTGLSRETISRQINILKKQYDIEVGRKGITTGSLAKIKEDLGLLEI